MNGPTISRLGVFSIVGFVLAGGLAYESVEKISKPAPKCVERRDMSSLEIPMDGFSCPLAEGHAVDLFSAHTSRTSLGVERGGLVLCAVQQYRWDLPEEEVPAPLESEAVPFAPPAPLEGSPAAWQTWETDQEDQGVVSGEFHESDRATREKQMWNLVKEEDTIRGFRRFWILFPDGQYAAEARQRIRELLADDRPYQEALAAGTAEALEKFLRDYPGHQREREAEALLKRRRGSDDFQRLVLEGRIHLTVRGGGVRSVRVTLHSTGPGGVSVTIPPGLRFVPPLGSSVQEMVTLAPISVSVPGGQNVTVSIPSVCAALRRDVPGSDDTLRLADWGEENRELQRVIRVLADTDVDYAVQQAAVWIVTDNASFEDMGVLQTAIGPFPIGRTIQEKHVVQAMQLCEEAGIDITRKAIWKDRTRLLRELPEGCLKEYLEARIRVPEAVP